MAGAAARAEATRALAPIYGFGATVVEQLGRRIVQAIQPYDVPAAGKLTTELLESSGGKVLAAGTQSFAGPSIVVSAVMRYTRTGLGLGALRQAEAHAA